MDGCVVRGHAAELPHGAGDLGGSCGSGVFAGSHGSGGFGFGGLGSLGGRGFGFGCLTMSIAPNRG